MRLNAFVNPLKLFEWEKVPIPTLPENPTPERLLKFLCSLGLSADMAAFKMRYREVSTKDQGLFLSPQESELVENLFGPLRQAKTSYLIGNYVGTIGLCGMVAEKVAILIHAINTPDEGERERFERDGQACRVETLKRRSLVLNIAGEKLTGQELRNAVYAGPWVFEAKRHFSRKGAACPAYAIGSRFVNGRAERQEYLETAIQWIKDEGQTVEEYMAAHQHDKTATALWSHFQSVINRVEAVFPKYRGPMKGVDWGGLYVHLKNESLDPKALEDEVARLTIDDDVTRKAGIYAYLLTGEERHLSIRAFTAAMKQTAFEIQKGICKVCAKAFEIADMEADHITPWSEGGKTIEQNCQMLCKHCNRRKSNK